MLQIVILVLAAFFPYFLRRRLLVLMHPDKWRGQAEDAVVAGACKAGRRLSKKTQSKK